MSIVISVWSPVGVRHILNKVFDDLFVKEDLPLPPPEVRSHRKCTSQETWYGQDFHQSPKVGYHSTGPYGKVTAEGGSAEVQGGVKLGVSKLGKDCQSSNHSLCWSLFMLWSRGRKWHLPALFFSEMVSHDPCLLRSYSEMNISSFLMSFPGMFQTASSVLYLHRLLVGLSL